MNIRDVCGRQRALASGMAAAEVSRGLTAATPVKNPYCRCRLADIGRARTELGEREGHVERRRALIDLAIGESSGIALHPPLPQQVSQHGRRGGVSKMTELSPGAGLTRSTATSPPVSGLAHLE